MIATKRGFHFVNLRLPFYYIADFSALQEEKVPKVLTKRKKLW